MVCCPASPETDDYVKGQRPLKKPHFSCSEHVSLSEEATSDTGGKSLVKEGEFERHMYFCSSSGVVSS